MEESDTMTEEKGQDQVPRPGESIRPAGLLISQNSIGKTLVVGIPALNEEKTIREVIERIPRTIPGVANVSIVVIDDGSDDTTALIAHESGARVIRHPQPAGVGAAFHTLLSFVIDTRADLLVTIDGDGQFEPEGIPALIEPVISDEADFSTASRFKDESLTPQMPLIKLWGNRLMSRLVSRLVRQRFYDVSCGMRCYSRKAALHLHLVGWFTYTQEVFLNLSFKHLRMVEVPLLVRGERRSGKSRVAANLWRYGWQTIKIIFRCYRDYFPLRVFGGMAIALSVPAVVLATFLAIHYLQNGTFTPHKWAGFASVALFFFATRLVNMGMTGDMLNRHRIYLEEILYRQRSGWLKDQNNLE